MLFGLGDTMYVILEGGLRQHVTIVCLLRRVVWIYGGLCLSPLIGRISGFRSVFVPSPRKPPFDCLGLVF